jgi:hypothetical protein
MKHIKAICISLLVAVAVSVTGLSQQECYLGESIIGQDFQGCPGLSKFEVKWIYFWDQSGMTAFQSVSLNGHGECCIIGTECWPQFMEPHGYSAGGPSQGYWVGRWSQSVFNQTCNWGICSNNGFQRFTAEHYCQTALLHESK